MKYAKGDVVLVAASVFTESGRDTKPHEITLSALIHATNRGVRHDNLTLLHRGKKDWTGTTRDLWRYQYDAPWRGLVIGFGFRQTGAVHHGSYDDPGYLTVDKRHTVIMVEPLDTTRFLQPIACLEDDLQEEPCQS